MESSHISLPLMGTEIAHRFSSTWLNKNVSLENNGSSVIRNRHFSSGLAFASSSLWQSNEDEIFEIRLDDVSRQWSGALRFGVATQIPMANQSDSSQQLTSPMKDLSSLSGDVYWLESNNIKHNGNIVKMNYTITPLERLVSGDKLGVRRLHSDGSLRFLLNGEDCGIAVPNVPKKIIPVVELYGSTISVSVVSVSQMSHPSPIGSMAHKLPSMNTMMDSLEVVLDTEKNDKETDLVRPIRIPPGGLEFHENHGRNVQLKNSNTTAIRTDSYNQGMLLTSKPLKENEIFEVKLDRLNNRWTSSLMIGALFESPDKLHLPVTALGLKKNAIVISGDTLYQNGHKVQTLGFNIDSLTTSQSVGILIDAAKNLKVLVNGQDHGIAVQNVPSVCYGLVDLYGQCEEITIVRHSDANNEASNEPPTTNSILEEDISTKDLFTTSMHNPIILRGPNQSILHPNSSSNNVTKCEYFKMCSKFKASLALPTHFFHKIQACTCHCSQCIKVRGEELYAKKGDPPKDFALPLHWCRFPIKPTRAEPTTETWHTTYHGTKTSSLRKILDHGELIPLQSLGSL